VKISVHAKSRGCDILKQTAHFVFSNATAGHSNAWLPLEKYLFSAAIGFAALKLYNCRCARVA
jgi:hypothetical protein